jgi:hypothetical protein
MTFWTGFATGLAKSVDQGLQKAMDKRDDELSRAKTFWQTRQAQKLDQKEAYDARAEKALRRMIKEAGDDTSLGLAAWNAAGGDADSVESFIKRIDETRANKGTYNLLDSLIGPDGTPIKAGESIDINDALSSVRMQMKGIDESNINVADPLEKFGLGIRGGGAKQVVESVNALIPQETVAEITGVPKGTLDMTTMIDAEKYANSQKLLAKQLSTTLAEDHAAIVKEIMAIDVTTTEGAEQAKKAEAKQKTILAAMGKEAVANDTSTEGSITVPTLNSMYSQQLTARLAARGINTKEQSYVKDGNVIYGDGEGFLKATQEVSNEFNDEFVNTLKRSDNSFGPSASTFISNNIELQKSMNRILKAGSESEDKPKPGDVPKPPVKTNEERINDIKTKHETPVAYVQSFKNLDFSNKTIANAVLRDMMAAYNIDVDAATEIMNIELERKRAEVTRKVKEAANAPVFETRAEKAARLKAETDDANRKKDAQESANFSFSAEG